MFYSARVPQPQQWASFFFFILVSFLTAPVQAEETRERAESLSPPRRSRYELSLFSGISLTQPSDLRIMQPSTATDATFKDVHWKGHPFQGSRYYGFRLLTYLPHQPRVGIGFDYVHYKVYAQVNQDRRIVGDWQGEPIDIVAPMNERVQEFRITNGVNVATLAINYRFPQYRSKAFPEGRLQPYVGGGPSYYRLFPINRVNRKSNRQHGYQSSGFGYTLQAGIRYGVIRHGAVFLETRYNRADAKVDIAQDGDADTDLRTAHIQAGFSLDL